jgi:uncharacterized protein (TIGR02246 family)
MEQWKHRCLLILAAFLTSLACMTPVASRASAADEAAIKGVLSKYQDALNASSTPQVMPLYTDDGIFMWEFHQSVIGKAELHQAYDDVFKAITLKVEFKVAEVVPMSSEWAFARTNSSGTQTDKATGARTAEGNQELFVFHKGSDGVWRIARYSFSSTNPPPH